MNKGSEEENAPPTAHDSRREQIRKAYCEMRENERKQQITKSMAVKGLRLVKSDK